MAKKGGSTKSKGYPGISGGSSGYHPCNTPVLAAILILSAAVYVLTKLL